MTEPGQMPAAVGSVPERFSSGEGRLARLGLGEPERAMAALERLHLLDIPGALDTDVLVTAFAAIAVPTSRCVVCSVWPRRSTPASTT